MAGGIVIAGVEAPPSAGLGDGGLNDCAIRKMVQFNMLTEAGNIVREGFKTDIARQMGIKAQKHASETFMERRSFEEHLRIYQVLARRASK